MEEEEMTTGRQFLQNTVGHEQVLSFVSIVDLMFVCFR